MLQVARCHRNCHTECGEKWFECSVAKTNTQSVYERRQIAQKKGRDMALKLKVGDYVAVQDREHQEHAVPFWIGQLVDAGNGSCIAEKDFTKRKKIGETRFDPGDVAVAVKW